MPETGSELLASCAAAANQQNVRLSARARSPRQSSLRGGRTALHLAVVDGRPADDALLVHDRLEAVLRQVIGVQDEILVVAHCIQHCLRHVVLDVSDVEDGVPIPHPRLKHHRAVLGAALGWRQLEGARGGPSETCHPGCRPTDSTHSVPCQFPGAR
eukprot:2822704-Prymnesium_polylepis.1